MSPKTEVSKKRKASISFSQATLDSFKTQNKDIHTKSKTNKDTEDSLPGTTTESMSVNREGNHTINVSSILGSFRCHSIVNKITVDNFKESTPQMLSNDEFERLWEKLQRVLRDILFSTHCTTSVQAAYELCGDLCRFGYAEAVYGSVHEEIASYISKIATELDELANGKDRFLFHLNEHWLKYCDHLVTIRNVFMELDRRYIIHTTSYSSLIDLGKDIFRRIVLSRDTIKSRLIEDALLLIQNERDGDLIETHVLHSLLQMMVELKLYSTHFEPRFMEKTVTYYHSEGARLIEELDMAQFLIHVQRRREEEGTVRIHDYLPSTTKTCLIEAVTDQLVYKRITKILEKGFGTLMDEGQKVPLRILFETLFPGGELDTLRTAFANYVKHRGTTLIEDPTKDSQFVLSLLQFKAKLDDIISTCFYDNAKFKDTLKGSFESFINKRQNKPAELVAKFIDSKLRSSGKRSATEENIGEVLDRVIVIFRLLQSKDSFEAFYKRFLAKRLLLNRSVSNDLEKSIIAKLKAECGPDFTRNMEAMFKDIEVSADLNTTFKDSPEYKLKGDTNIYINVLAQGIWPSYSLPDIILPQEMLEYQRKFEKFYTIKFKGRRLVWRSSLGTCSVKANFPIATKELTVSLSQASVLLLFNDSSRPSISYTEIMQMTGLDDKELIRVLQSLACGQHRVLNKDPEGAKVESSDVFSYNNDFTAAPYRLRINTVQQEQTVEERKEVQSKVLETRKHQLEAAIVRIMKAKKRVNHATLVSELFVYLKFPIEAADIKRRIESLIDREYMSRDDNDNSVYVYRS